MNEVINLPIKKSSHLLAPTPPWHDSPPVGQSLLNIEAPRSHSVGRLWTSDQPDAETSAWIKTQHSQETDTHTPGRIRTRNTSKREAADPRLRPRLLWSQNRHKTANQHLSGYTTQALVATFNPTCMSRLTAIQGLLVLSLLIVSDDVNSSEICSLRLRQLGTCSSSSLP